MRALPTAFSRLGRSWHHWAWLLIVLVASAYLGLQARHGLPLRTDLMALLPREDQDPVRQYANEAVSLVAARRVVLLVGNASRERARAAAVQLGDRLAAIGVAQGVERSFGADRLSDLQRLYRPHRNGLLSERDRALLEAGRGDALATRALSQMFGFAGLADGASAQGDPFLLLPAFLAELPLPLSRLVPDEDTLSVTEDGMTWVFITAQIAGDPLDLNVQDRVVKALDTLIGETAAAVPNTEVLRLGVVFFAHEAAQRAMAEASVLGTISLVGCLLLVLVVFRRWTPLLHTLLVTAVGFGVAMAGSIAVFGELHVASLLFGTSLIGIAVDYCLHYSASGFHRAAFDPFERMRQVRPGITLGLLTTMIGYSALAAAPFPGLRQLAVFTIIGLCASYLTVVLWLPRLDRMGPLAHGRQIIAAADLLPQFWEAKRLGWLRTILVVGLVAGTVAGFARISVEDDVRRMQRLSPDLLVEQGQVRRLIGAGVEGSFLLVEAATDADALVVQERLEGPLAKLRAEGAVGGWRMPSAFVPSPTRQQADQALIRDRLEQPHLAAQLRQLGLPVSGEGTKRDAEGVGALTLDAAMRSGALPVLADLVLRPGLHVVLLEGVTAPERIRAAVADLADIRFADPTGDFSRLLARYRERAVVLTAVSVALMVPLLWWRYGWSQLWRVLLPPVVAVVTTPALLALGGEAFTFFHAMALVLVLSIGMDYALFCAESGRDHRAITMVAIWLATLTTLLGFGLLGFSQVHAVSGFGLTMSIGMVLAFLLSPFACRPEGHDP